MAPRTPLLRPDRYFRERRPSALRGFGVIVVVTVALVAAVYGFGYVMTANVDGTVMVDNPAHPGEHFCENPPSQGPESLDYGCDEPAEVERNVDHVIWKAMNTAVGQLFWVPFVGWVVVGAVLHAASWLAGGDGGPGRTFAIAGWGTAPTVVSLALGVGLFAVTFDPVTVTPGMEPSAFEGEVRASIGPLETAGVVGGALTTLWTGTIWFFGLHDARGLTLGRAAAIAGGLTLLLLLGGS